VGMGSLANRDGASGFDSVTGGETGDQRFTVATVVARRAAKTIREFAACGYSQSRRRDAQFSGFCVQFSVA
jgi:hypothetical protein